MALLDTRRPPYMNYNLGNYMGQLPLGQPGAAPSAFSAYVSPHHQLEHNPFLLAAQAAQALTAAHLGLQACNMSAAEAQQQLHQQQQQHLPRSPRSEGSGGASEQSQDGETDDERRGVGERHMRGPPSSSAGVAGMKIPVVCNDVRGLVYLDQQVVGCYCPACEARVATGHDRPLFSFTRFERHCGSKAKKWRLSLRIEPGAVKECPPGDGPMPLGQWMEMRGLISWGARSSVKIGHRESDDDDTALPDGTYSRRPAVGPMHVQDRRAAGTLAVLAGATTALSGREREAPNSGNGQAPAAARQGLLPLKREREEYDTPDLPDQANRADWLEVQRRRFEAAAAETPGGGGGGGGSTGSGAAGKHGAIFKLVYGLLEGPDRRSFNEDYLPWLNELPAQRLEQEFNTLLQYLHLLSDMPWQAVQGLMRAYIKAILARIKPK